MSEPSLVFNRHTVLYSSGLPGCYCVHAKDGLPQLGQEEETENKKQQKKIFVGSAERQGSASIKEGLKLSHPDLSLSEALMCACEHAWDKPC